MRAKLTKRAADQAPVGFTWDTELRGFGLRVRESGKRSWVLRYISEEGRDRRMVLGTYPPLTPDQARREAMLKLAQVQRGADPIEARRTARAAPTVADLAERYRREHLPKNKPTTRRENERLLEKHVLPAFGRKRVDAISTSDVSRLHSGLGERPVLANRVWALLSRLFSLAEDWGYRPRGSNPVTGVQRFREQGRERHLSEIELRRLGNALAEAEPGEPQKVAAIRLLLFTGCRRGEVLSLRWDDLDLDRGLIYLGESKTGRRPVVLNAPARMVLEGMTRADSEWLFPAPRGNGPLREIRKTWTRITTAARLEGLRLHDLRHTHASQGLLEGLSLPAIGALLGHAKASTTQRYAHFAQDSVREASEKVGRRLGKALGELES